MAEAVSNIRLEYAPNLLEFIRTDDAGVPQSFDVNSTTFNVERVDNKAYHSVTTVIDATGSIITFADVDGVTSAKCIVQYTPDPLVLYVAGDEMYTHASDVFIHIFSLRNSSQVYLAGGVHLYEVAGA